jgi:hypothetical protein
VLRRNRRSTPLSRASSEALLVLPTRCLSAQLGDLFLTSSHVYRRPNTVSGPAYLRRHSMSPVGICCATDMHRPSTTASSLLCCTTQHQLSSAKLTCCPTAHACILGSLSLAASVAVTRGIPTPNAQSTNRKYPRTIFKAENAVSSWYETASTLSWLACRTRADDDHGIVASSPTRHPLASKTISSGGISPLSELIALFRV